MREPISVRVSDPENQLRGDQFEAVLGKRKARMSDIIRGLIDAYIECDGDCVFPVRLFDYDKHDDVLVRAVEETGMGRMEAARAIRRAAWEMVKRCGGIVFPAALVPLAALTPAVEKRCKEIVAETKRRT